MSKEKEELAEELRVALNCKPEELYKKYKKYKDAEAEFKELYEPFKERIISLHKAQVDIPNSIIVGGLKLIYVAPSVRSSIDSKKLKEEEPEIAKKFTKNTNVDAMIRLESI